MPLTLWNIAFQALSLSVLGAFCWTIYRFRGQTVECLKSVVAFSSSKSAAVENKRLYDRFLNTAIVLGALSTGLAAVKVATAALATGTWQWRLVGLAGTTGMADMPWWAPLAATLIVASAAAGIVMVEVGIIRIAGSVTLSSKFTGAIVQIKRNCLAAASIMFVPLTAVWTGVNPVRDATVAYIALAMTVTLSVMFLVHTLKSFLKQNVSVLIWFLYLCTVEVFPVGAVVLATTKSL